MPLSILGQVLCVDRHRQRWAKDGGVAPPIVTETHEKLLPVGEGAGPFLVTTSRGLLIPTRTSKEGLVRSAFCERSLEEETQILQDLYANLRDASPSRCTSVQMAASRLNGPVKAIVMSYKTLPDVFDVPPDQFKEQQSYVTTIDEVPIFSADLPHQCALVFGALAGLYTRSGDYVSLLIWQAGRNIVAVSP